MPETLLGVPKDLLLRAMEICLIHGSLKFPYKAMCNIEHAFRVWLVGKGCKVSHEHESTYVTRSDASSRVGGRIHVALDIHHLTALAQAVCKIGEK